jgi:N-acetylmuramoyl-L-alanine amidase
MTIKNIVILIGFTLLCSLMRDKHLVKPSIQTVVIDPGHGGKDSGCLGANSNEKTVTLGIALKLGKKIKAKFPSVKIVYTRKKDEFVELHRRAKIANEHQADLFISIHCNATPTNKDRAHGSETYVLGLHRADDNLEVMKRENDVILLESNYEDNYDYNPNNSENHILNALFQDQYLNQSISFAHKIEREVVLSKRKSRGVKQAGFAVLRGATMPAVLVESDFLTHPKAGQFLITDKGQEQVSNCIFKAFEKYKNELEFNETSVESVERKSIIMTEKSPNASSTMASKILFEHMVEVDSKVNFEFKIQLAATTQLENSNFAALVAQNEQLEILEEGKMKKLLAKGYTTYEAALLGKADWKKAGYSQAFVVVYKNNVRTTMADYKAYYKD